MSSRPEPREMKDLQRQTGSFFREFEEHVDRLRKIIRELEVTAEGEKSETKGKRALVWAGLSCGFAMFAACLTCGSAIPVVAAAAAAAAAGAACAGFVAVTIWKKENDKKIVTQVENLMKEITRASGELEDELEKRKKTLKVCENTYMGLEFARRLETAVSEVSSVLAKVKKKLKAAVVPQPDDELERLISEDMADLLHALNRLIEAVKIANQAEEEKEKLRRFLVPKTDELRPYTTSEADHRQINSDEFDETEEEPQVPRYTANSRRQSIDFLPPSLSNTTEEEQREREEEET